MSSPVNPGGFTPFAETMRRAGHRGLEQAAQSEAALPDQHLLRNSAHSLKVETLSPRGSYDLLLLNKTNRGKE